jgi:hypothetical protein
VAIHHDDAEPARSQLPTQAVVVRGQRRLGIGGARLTFVSLPAGPDFQPAWCGFRGRPPRYSCPWTIGGTTRRQIDDELTINVTAGLLACCQVPVVRVPHYHHVASLPTMVEPETSDSGHAVNVDTN